MQVEPLPSDEEQRISVEDPSPFYTKKRASYLSHTSAEASTGMEDLPPSPPPHPEVGKNTPEYDARDPSTAEGMSAPLQWSEARSPRPRFAPAANKLGNSKRPVPEDDEDKFQRKLSWQPNSRFQRLRSISSLLPLASPKINL